MNATTVLYNNIKRLCDPTTNWKKEQMTIRSLDRFINDNLGKFFSASDEFGKKEKLNALLNFRERIIQEFQCKLGGEVLALAVSGIAHEVFKEGRHSLYKPTEIRDQIAFHILSQNLFSLDKIFLKDNNDIFITDKFKENLDNAIMRILDEYKISLATFGMENAAEAVDFVIDHKDQLCIANLSKYEDLDSSLLEKLRIGCPHLQKLDLSCCSEFVDISELAKVLEKMTSLKYLNFSYNLHRPHEALLLALKKLTSLTYLNLNNRFSPFNNSRVISLKDLSLTIEKMTHLETIVIPEYDDYNEEEINEFIQTLGKLLSLRFILSTDKIWIEKIKEKLKTNAKVEEYIATE